MSAREPLIWNTYSKHYIHDFYIMLVMFVFVSYKICSLVSEGVAALRQICAQQKKKFTVYSFYISLRLFHRPNFQYILCVMYF